VINYEDATLLELILRQFRRRFWPYRALSWRRVQYVVPRVTIQGLLLPLLVESMADKSDTPAQSKQTIQAAKLKYLHNLAPRVASYAAKHVRKQGSDSS
jgi:hypothetical protein